MNREIIIVIFVISLLVFYVDPTFDSDVTFVVAKLDNRKYIVRNIPNSKQQAAELLANINEKNLKLLTHLKQNFPNDPRTILFEKNYNPNAISEGSANDQYTSYSINKGEKIIYCLRSKENNEFMNINTLTYISYHEISHLLTESIGHDSSFWDNFKWLLSEAVKINLYTIEDYSLNNVRYCGIDITNNILIDSEKKNK